MTARSTAKKNAVEEFFAGYPHSVAQLASALRALILQSIPGAQEILDGSARVVGYGLGTGYKKTVRAIIMSKKGVKLGLADGALLADPKGLLAGAGKRHRHVAFETLADLKRPGVKPLLEACYAAWRARTLETPSPARTKKSA